jgi:hypothetical protein
MVVRGVTKANNKPRSVKLEVKMSKEASKAPPLVMALRLARA